MKKIRFRRRAVGVYYCTRHDGVMNEDDHSCDFSRGDGVELSGRTGEPLACKPRRCFILERA